LTKELNSMVSEIKLLTKGRILNGRNSEMPQNLGNLDCSGLKTILRIHIFDINI